MPDRTEDFKRDRVTQLLEAARMRLPEERAPLAERFLRLFCRDVPPSDFLEIEPDALYGAALSLLKFADQRPAGGHRVRAYTPNHDEHGWQTGHSVVEIVNDDMPFLVNSVTSGLNALGVTVHLVIHPILDVVRGDGDTLGLEDLAEPGANGAEARPVRSESWMHLEIDEQADGEALDGIVAMLDRVLADVRAAVADWRPMRARLRDSLAALDTLPPSVAGDTLPEIRAFLEWLENDHFTFLGVRDYAVHDEGGDRILAVSAERGLGVLRAGSELLFDGIRRHLDRLPDRVRDYVLRPVPMVVTKASRVSTVHRAVPMDAVVIKRFDDTGQLIGETVFAGLFTSVSYNRSARDIPHLRQKVDQVVARSGFKPSGHDGKALVNIIDTLPRDELFQIDTEALLDIAVGVLNLQERQRTALFLRPDPLERFVSCLVYVPRDRYGSDMRKKLEVLLEAALDGRVTHFDSKFGDGAHARVHFVVKTTPGQVPDIDRARLERQLVEAARSWADGLQTALVEARGEETGLTLHRRYAQAFPSNYCERTPPVAALADIDRIEGLLAGGDIGLNLYRPIECADHELRFKLYLAGRPVPLSDVLPMLEHMGLKVISEDPYRVQPSRPDKRIWIHDFSMESRDRRPIDIGAIKDLFQDAFAQVWRGAMEDDGFNGLVLAAGLAARQVVLVRAFAKYLAQAGMPFTQDRVGDTLAAHPAIARLIVAMFEDGFDPARPGDASARESAMRGRAVNIEHLLEDVESLTEDRIIRRLVNLVLSVLRTNFYQPGADGAPKPYIALKLESPALDDLPKPVPWREVFVYAPDVEGIHLRYGSVARGGLRWSDRHEDFRTEILGLVKAQQVKNAVIVPVGAKGGFVVKRPPPPGSPRDQVIAAAIDCYRTFLRGLLDITDNTVGEDVVPPRAVFRRAPDDH